MAGRPGTIVQRRAQRTVPGVATDTGVAFLVGITEKGPVGETTLLRSADDYDRFYGGRGGAYSLLADSVETVFGEAGGGTVGVSRVVGPAAAKASVTLVDRAGVPVNTLRIDALYVGAYANAAAGGYEITVQDGSVANTFNIVVLLDGAEVERFTNLASPAAAVDALAASDHVRAVDLASATAAPGNNPAVVAAADLAGGTDDQAGITDATWQTATDAIPANLGPGQVAQPGRTTAAAHTQLLNHAAARNRTALLDTANRASKATLVAAADAVDDLVNAKHGGIFATWVTIPQIVAGVDREVPGSAFTAGRIAHVDRLEDANTAPIGDLGLARYALNATSTFSDADRSDLTDAGVNVAIDTPNLGLRLYGFRTVSSDPDWRLLSNQRLAMHIDAQATRIAERFVGKNISTELLGDYAAALDSEVLLPLHQSRALYGDSPEDSYLVVVGDPVNTVQTAEAQELNAEIYAKFAGFAELVRVTTVKVPLSAPLAA